MTLTHLILGAAAGAAGMYAWLRTGVPWDEVEIHANTIHADLMLTSAQRIGGDRPTAGFTVRYRPLTGGFDRGGRWYWHVAAGPVPAPHDGDETLRTALDTDLEIFSGWAWTKAGADRAADFALAMIADDEGDEDTPE